jgi:hypothetical protein
MPESGAVGSAPLRPRGRSRDALGEDGGVQLIEITIETWSQGKEENRQSHLQEIDQLYHDQLQELYELANLCVDKYEQLSSSHSRWRRTVIMGTGVVALFNVVAAYKWNQDWQPVFAVGAALAAIMLSVLANLESSSNCLEQAQVYRESRELFLDVAREYDRLWNSYVIPLSDRAEACINADELYRRLINKDRELRGKLKDLTKTESKKKR